MEKQFYINKTEKMLEDLLTKLHQSIANGEPCRIGDIEILKELNHIYFNQDRLNKKH